MADDNNNNEEQAPEKEQEAPAANDIHSYIRGSSINESIDEAAREIAGDAQGRIDSDADRLTAQLVDADGELGGYEEGAVRAEVERRLAKGARAGLK